MVVVRRGLGIVVMPVGHRLHQVRELQRVLGTVRTVLFRAIVLLQSQVQTHP